MKLSMVSGDNRTHQRANKNLWHKSASSKDRTAPYRPAGSMQQRSWLGGYGGGVPHLNLLENKTKVQ